MVTRSQHRREMLRRLSDAACDAFEDRGARATIDDIAARAGVARRTVFRYVDHKEDLAYLHPRIWLDVLDEAADELTDEPLRDRILHGARRISEHIDRDPAPVRRAMDVVRSNPSLAKGEVTVQHAWIRRLTREVGDRTDDPFRAHIVAAAVMGVINAAVGEWYRSADDTLLVDIVARGLDYLGPVLDSGAEPDATLRGIRFSGSTELFPPPRR